MREQQQKQDKTDRMEVVSRKCPLCGHRKMFVMDSGLRGHHYKCCKCKKRWNDKGERLQ